MRTGVGAGQTQRATSPMHIHEKGPGYHPAGILCFPLFEKVCSGLPCQGDREGLGGPCPLRAQARVLLLGQSLPPQVSEKDTTCLLEASTSAQCRGQSPGPTVRRELDACPPLLSQTHPDPEELPLVIPRRGALGHGESPLSLGPSLQRGTPPCQAVTAASVPEPRFEAPFAAQRPPPPSWPPFPPPQDEAGITSSAIFQGAHTGGGHASLGMGAREEPGRQAATAWQ